MRMTVKLVLAVALVKAVYFVVVALSLADVFNF